MKCNVKSPPIHTHGGAVASKINAEQQLRRAVMACMLWEDQFYEDGETIADRIADLVPQIKPAAVAAMAIEARSSMKLRHVPLLLAREMLRHEPHRTMVAQTLETIIQRADELTEFLALYWKDGKKPLPAQVKKGLARAFTKFCGYDLAKYNRDGAVKLRDVLFLCHAKPKDVEQAAVWKQLVDGTLVSPDTWEVALSSGADKKATWERLITERKLGGLATLRNLRNMIEAGVGDDTIRAALGSMNTERVLPFRFVAAARYAPKFEPEIEQTMFASLSGAAKLPGKTVLVVDVSGSMGASLSARSEMTRMEAAFGVAILARELCEECAVYATAGNDGSRIHATKLVPSRRGFALADAVRTLAAELGGGGIFLSQCTQYIAERERTADRLIVLTDEQDCDLKLNPAAASAFGRYNYLINIASAKNGIGYGKFTHIDGWSEAALAYIQSAEMPQNALQ